MDIPGNRTQFEAAERKAPLDKKKHIKRLPLFSELDDNEIALIEPLFSVQKYSAGEYVYRQAEYSHAMYLFLSGRGRLLRVDEKGIERSEAEVEPGEFVGEKSLFLHTARPRSLVISRDVTALVLPRYEFEPFIRAHPDIKARLNVYGNVVKATEQDFPWLNKGEIVLNYDRRHIWVFLRRAALAVPLFVFLLPVHLIILLAPLPNVLAVVTLVLSIIAALLYVAYTYFDWENDWFVVTNQRVLREERVLLTFSQMNQQASLDSIQTVNIEKKGYFEERLDFGDLIISTAGINITFDTIPDPEKLAALIKAEVGRKSDDKAAMNRKRIREEIDEFMGVKTLAKTRDENTIDAAPPPSQPPAPAPVEPVYTRLEKRLERLMDYLDIRVRIDDGFRVTYRTHWLILWRAIVGPLFGTVVLLFVLGAAIAYRNVWPWNAVHPIIEILLFLLAMIGILLWLWWEYEDWHNDQYVIEEMMIIHTHRRPLWQENLERSIPIKNIQGVEVTVTGIWQQILNYGTVKVQTAADANPDGGSSPGEIFFEYIYQPHAFRDDVQHRLSEGRKQEQKDQQEVFSEQIARWLAVYHQANNPDAFELARSNDVDKGQIADDDTPYKSEDI